MSDQATQSANSSADCQCGSGANYKQCCGRLHAGGKAESALALMRSRYCAYVRKNVDYIVKTTHPANHNKTTGGPKWKQEIAQFANETQFAGLKIVEFQDGNKSATVTFTAFLFQSGRDISFTEKSLFEKVNGAWLYKSGERLETTLV